MPRKEAGKQEVQDLHAKFCSLQNYADKLEATLKLPDDDGLVQEKDELLGYKHKVQCLEEKIADYEDILKNTQVELSKAKHDNEKTMKVLQSINSSLNLAAGMVRVYELEKSGNSIQVAERLEKRVARLISLWNHCRLEERDQSQCQAQIKPSEIKRNNRKKKA